MTGQGDGHAGAAGMRLRGALLLGMALALAGCGETGGLSGPGASGDAAEAPAASAPASGALGTTDVLAPELFQVAEPGLWDGRPSLGGIWVAHPRVVNPERVRIVNRTNGQEVIGALFRRERDLPGPALQVSSDAAQALGMLAGAPAELEVTALRRQDAPDAAPPAAEPGPVADAPTGTEVAEALGTAPAPEVAPAPATPVDPAAVEAVNRATAAILAAAPLADPAAPSAGAQPAPDAIATTALGAPSAGPATAPSGQSYVQLGQFGVEANATEAARLLAAEGLPAGIVAEGGVWRLLLGPAATDAERAALLEAAVAAGFADAYVVSL